MAQRKAELAAKKEQRKKEEEENIDTDEEEAKNLNRKEGDKPCKQGKKNGKSRPANKF